MLLEKYDEREGIKDEQSLLWYGMICYAMLSCAMVWYGKYGML